MSAELLAGIVGVALSLAFAYIPGLKDKFNALSGDYKRLVMGLLLAVSALLIGGGQCGGIIDVGVACNSAGWQAIGSALLVALIANQSAYTFAGDRAQVAA